MENYLLVNNYGKSNTPDRIYYIMRRDDLPNLIKEESVVFGDKAYILEEGTMMFMGNDGTWYDMDGEVPVITTKELNITENGTYTDPDPYVAYSPVKVNVPGVIPEAITITDNGTYSESGKAYSPVTVAVPLGTKSITANGTYNAIDDSLKGYSSVSVDVPQHPSIVYGFHIDGSETDPDSAIIYLQDAVGMTPAHMDYANDRFDYGSWADSFIIKGIKPCILGMDGEVKKYLDPNDYTKDIDGNTVTIDENLTDANVMIEFPKIYYKIVPDTGDDTSASVYFSNQKVDDGYKDYAYINYEKHHREHFYMAAYNSSTIDSKLRSLSGQTSTKTKSLSGTTEISYAEANGNGWSTEHAGQVMLINLLLMLIGRNTDTQATFGQGVSEGGETAFNNYTTGSLNNKGLFYGSSGTSTAVKVFGIENWWALQWRRYRGDILSSNTLKIKLCYGQEDGSTTDNFNTDGTGYVTIGSSFQSGTSGNYITKCKFTADGMYQMVAGSRTTTDSVYKDGLYFSASEVRFASRGGHASYGSHYGAFTVARNSSVSIVYWSLGAALSFI